MYVKAKDEVSLDILLSRQPGLGCGATHSRIMWFGLLYLRVYTGGTLFAVSKTYLLSIYRLIRTCLSSFYSVQSILIKLCDQIRPKTSKVASVAKC